jgi:tetratricopeptide (TPR) repeat protein
MLANARINQGDIDAARAMALDGLAEARQLGLRDIEARNLNLLAMAAEQQGDIVGALALDRQNLRIQCETGDRVNQAMVQGNLGMGLRDLGDVTQARREFDAALQMGRANGDRGTEAHALTGLSMLALWQGEETRALALARQALEIAVSARVRGLEMQAALALGDAEAALGRLTAARRAYAQSLAVALAIGSAWEHDAHARLASVALAEGDTASALEILQPLLDATARGALLDGTEHPRRIELTCHRVLASTGDPRSAAWLERAHTALMAQADAIGRSSDDATLRHGFLNNIPHHRAIVAAWAQVATVDT